MDCSEKKIRKQNPRENAGIFNILSFNISETIVMGKFMTYFVSGSNVTVNEASLYASGLIGGKIVFMLYDNTYLLAVWLIGLRMQIACCTMIYRKCLKLNLSLGNENNQGKAVTLITKDVTQLLTVADCAHMLLIGIPKFFIMLSIMYTYIGVSAFAGAAIVMVMVPVNIFLGKLISQYRLKTAAHTDQRVRMTQEMLTSMRVIKMHTWENFFSKTIGRHRLNGNLENFVYIKALVFSIGQLSYRFAFYVCVITYVALGNHITAEKAFVIIGSFGAFQSLLTDYMPNGIPQMAEYKASLHRLTKFLMLDEVPDSHHEDQDNYLPIDRSVSVKDVTVKTESETVVLDSVNLNIAKGLTVVVGSTGSGKSTLLKLLLGDVAKSSGEIKVCGKVSYASQEPWIFPSTVRQNIIFGEPFDEKRYQNVIKVCALEWDLMLLTEGDQTCMSDRGLNFSRGQKARVNLARAIYRQADVYLLDDCLSSVDGRVGKHIFDECIKRFLKDFVCILVINNSLPLEGSDKVLVLSKGKIAFHDTFNNFKQWDNEEIKLELHWDALHESQDTQEEKIGQASSLVEQNKNTATNIYDEHNKIGKVRRSIYYAYFICGGGWKIFAIVAICSIASTAAASWADYFVSYWVDMEQDLAGFRMNETTDSIEYKDLESRYDIIMKTYLFVMLGAAIFTVLQALTFFFFTSRASTKIHMYVIGKIIKALMTFFDKNLSGNVLNRLSRDLAIIDEQMPSVMLDSLKVILSMYGVLIIITSVNWYFIIPSLILTVIIYIARRLYMGTGRGLKRLEGAARSPVLGHLNATLEGLTTIRASNAQELLQREFDKHQDLYSSALFMNLSTSRAFGFYLDATCNLYITIIIFSFVISKTDTLAGLVGLAISQSFSLTGLLKWAARQWAEMETQMTSTERVLEYRDTIVEVSSGNKPENWPNNGDIEYKSVNLRYSSGGGMALNDLSFHIGSREKIGIVGRTGAGKTSIISTLFRMYEYEGTILIDGIDIKSVAINYLRSKISIIPQDLVLFSGTVRNNLDPGCEYLDKVLLDALDEVGIKNSLKDLDSEIVTLSVGEKQLLCLARAIVHNNKIIVLDEATANLDPETDTFIQKIIKRKFLNCTVITIAHKLRTVINSDKIIVMDAGHVHQFGTPKDLLENKKGLFYSIVRQAGLVD
ncbi:hypothetical protein RI129_005010 [Pyrocoelia pectoralis]|uniref:Multidrug resistance-associated protein lethal(2)03659 n=1 Tax=Pyrocoelia pectoralis TaxID=417401 RepID=A0AAN7VK91_9COLE